MWQGEIVGGPITMIVSGGVEFSGVMVGVQKPLIGSTKVWFTPYVRFPSFMVRTN